MALLTCPGFPPAGFTTARPMLTPNKVKVPGRKPQDEEDLTWAEAGVAPAMQRDGGAFPASFS